MDIYFNAIKSITDINKDVCSEAKKRLDSLIKPIGSLGELEKIAIKIAGITGKVRNKINKKNIIIMCSDNGVVEEGVSSAPQSITKLMAENFAKGNTGVCVLAKNAGSDITIVDIGINAEVSNENIINKKIAFGTENIAKGPAMSREQAIKAIETGIEMTDILVGKGYNLLGTGEMGIGNTTTSSAIISVLLDLEPEKVTGKGAGLTDAQYINKVNTIETSIRINTPDKHDVIDVLSKLGGYDIAGMCGCFLGAAKNKVPIVIDGLISAVAAYIAFKLKPETLGYMIPSHMSSEPGAKYIFEELGITPVINAGMRLGEGSGCPLGFFLIESALSIMNDMATFEEVLMDGSFLVDIEKKS